MKADAGIDIIKLTVDANGNQMVLFPTVIWDDKDVILVDTGLPGQFPSICNNLTKLPVSRLTQVIITHQDYDHIGSLPDVISGSNHKIEVMAHELCKPYIQGEEPLIKKGFTVPRTHVDTTIADGQVLPYCGGITVIFTPGHTPDHISLYHHSSKTLITSDALIAVQGQLFHPNKQLTLDMVLAIRSIKKFLDYEIDKVICYHGGICKNDIMQRLAELASGK